MNEGNGEANPLQ